jgi:hypothetical protein
MLCFKTLEITKREHYKMNVGMGSLSVGKGKRDYVFSPISIICCTR